MTDINITIPTLAVPIFYPRGALPIKAICERGALITDVERGYLVTFAS
ncbi:MAG TPA: hypothetical protein VMI72_03185 [Roseiarcus sp.]|nr:hypothetical protein [Roseiarcus sp.]